ncbi:thioester oxidase [Anaerocolumna cellulosilytica]|uniref:Thioester oxidase n=1 Tax=Anaerocolumna cellulosilytica TaxID=433286 RepID=A0A6S6R4U5_9FIRM|nr:SagB/ThcOx family dehydrogenase [Anaerocolumna cellulosilytica]MBB5194936.1 SagB-type dehydrogenase family enzyme [Anaerocolumna cellulosilytica]BCJ94101.1 thioester oxidase [Anaerocolumna cellulosilytica]
MSNTDMKEIIKVRREVMKEQDTENITSDQALGLPQPSIANEKKSDMVIELPNSYESVVVNNNFMEVLNNRTSKRKYSEEIISLLELAYLLWSTQGVKKVIGKERKATMRTVASAGARHPFETYLFVNRVEGLKPGLYHYLALEHKLEYLGEVKDQTAKVTEAFGDQEFFATAPVGFVWTVVPYRSEWRYTVNAQKYALLDAGHVCQNLYLAAESIGCGACAIGAYEQDLADKLLGLSSEPTSEKENEFVVYAASVGKLPNE